jgi:putative oxidoreductase
MTKGKRIALWTVSILLAALFFFAGGLKLLASDETAPMFIQFGFPAWFGTFIGVCEVLGAVGLLVPHLATLAAAGLSVIMVGAFLTMATHHQLPQSLMPLLVLALLLAVARARFKAALP